jgi:transcriptional regulator with XRE-family HTH domain
MERPSPKTASASSRMQKQTSNRSIWTRTSLLKRLSRGVEAREKFVESQINNGIAFQIRALRNRKGWSQPKLATEIGTTQNQIYRLENPDKTRPNVSSLKKIAKVFDVALIVQFVTFSQLINWAAGISPATLAPNSFDQENQPSLGGISDEAMSGHPKREKSGIFVVKDGSDKPSAADQAA